MATNHKENRSISTALMLVMLVCVALILADVGANLSSELREVQAGPQPVRGVHAVREPGAAGERDEDAVPAGDDAPVSGSAEPAPTYTVLDHRNE